MLAGLFNDIKDFVIKIKILFVYNLLSWKTAKQQKIQFLNNYNIWIVIDYKKFSIRVKMLEK